MDTAFRIIPCLLDIHNSTQAGDATVSSLLKKQGRDHLWDDRPNPAIDTVVIHYISACDIDAHRPFDLPLILKIFCEFAVSSHYLIQRDGQVYHLVPEEKRAWHCGGSIMPEPDGRTNVNDFSIGIELAATHESGFTPNQYASCAGLIAAIEKRIGRKCARVGHQDIAGGEAVRRGLRKEIKRDPGPLFNWELLARQTA
jgi:N-acetyl-anhydromuramyl-L-alanine amidase AmpD